MSILLCLCCLTLFWNGCVSRPSFHFILHGLIELLVFHILYLSGRSWNVCETSNPWTDPSGSSNLPLKGKNPNKKMKKMGNTRHLTVIIFYRAAWTLPRRHKHSYIQYSGLKHGIGICHVYCQQQLSIILVFLWFRCNIFW